MSEKKNKFTVSPIAAAVSTAVVPASAAIAQEVGLDSARLELEEVIVTARKREQNLQEVAATVQALPEAMLKDMGALNTEDYAKMIPSMVWRQEHGAGANQIIFRGINTGGSDFIATSSASMYLNEINVTMMGDQPGMRMMDLARVEALAGPQGTLYGAASQSGTLRILTHEPDATKFMGDIDTTFRTGSMSDESHSITGIINIPIVEDVFAIRIAAQTAEDGGYIDNVLGNTPNSWISGLSDNKQEWGMLDNSAVVEDNYNSVEYDAIRVSAKWDVNDRLSILLAHDHSENKANGYNDFNPFVGDLKTIAFAPNNTEEEWDLTSLTIEADLGFAQLVSATGFFEREYRHYSDATLYYKYWSTWACRDNGPGGSSNPAYAWYWADPVTGRAIYYPMYCPMGAPRGDDPTQQADYIGVVQGPSWQDKFSQEIRLSHQGDTLDWVAGLYYAESDDNWDAVWMKSITEDYQNTSSLAFLNSRYSNEDWCAANYSDPGAIGCGPGTSFDLAEYQFLSQDRTKWEQKAAFGEVTWHINDQWDATFGARWFETENTKSYLKYYAGYTLPSGRQQGSVIQPSFAPDTVGGQPVTGKIDEFVPKVAVSWKMSDDKMLYASYTEGFRTGGVNRANARADWTRTVFPQTWEPDKLKNYELGLRSRWADGTVQLNVTYFNMQWEDFQIEVVDPSVGTCIDTSLAAGQCGPAGELPWLKVVGNAGDAKSEGVEAHMDWVPAAGWSVGANAQWLTAETDADLVLDPRSNNVLPAGRALPNVPELKAGAWVSYTWPVNFLKDAEMRASAYMWHRSDSENLLIPSPETSSNPSFVNPSFTTLDLKLSLWVWPNDHGWQVDLFANNVTDERQITYTGTGKMNWAFGHTGQYEHGHRVYTGRPREIGLRFNYSWGD
jgi:outer membrane receptor protein involved in Fe transport